MRQNPFPIRNFRKFFLQKLFLMKKYISNVSNMIMIVKTCSEFFKACPSWKTGFMAFSPRDTYDSAFESPWPIFFVSQGNTWKTRFQMTPMFLPRSERRGSFERYPEIGNLLINLLIDYWGILTVWAHLWTWTPGTQMIWWESYNERMRHLDHQFLNVVSGVCKRLLVMTFSKYGVGTKTEKKVDRYTIFRCKMVRENAKQNDSCSNSK